MVARRAKNTAKRSTSKTKKAGRAARITVKKAAAAKARKGTTTPETLAEGPRLRDQGFRNAAAYPEDFHALYDRGFRSARGLTLPSEPQVSPQLHQMTEAVKDLD